MQLSIEIPDDLFLSINEDENSLASLAKHKLTLELYKKHKISLSQGAELLDMDIYTFMQLLNKNEIPVMDDYDIKSELNEPIKKFGGI